MLAPFLIAYAQTVPTAPALPAFTSSEFQSAVRAVESALNARDFAAAQRSAELLPKRNFTLRFDATGVPAPDREAFRQSAAQAMGNWGANASIDAPTPDIRISFAASLADDPKIGGPANLAVFYSSVPGHPRVSAVLGLQRGNPVRKADASDVLNDVRYAIGAYLGVASHPFAGYIMDPSAPTDATRSMWPVERTAALGALALSDRLRSAVAKQDSLGVSASPLAGFGADRYTGEALQGDQMEIPIPIQNSGAGALVVNAVGDCSCIVPEEAPVLGPGQKGTIQVRVDTRQMMGGIDRSAIILTNDPDHLIFTAAIHLDVSPRYRVILPAGSTWVVGEGKVEGDAYLTFAKGLDDKLLSARVYGLADSRVTFSRWSGDLPDPELNQPSAPRTGYRVHIVVPDGVPPGRYPATLSLYTDDPSVPRFTQTINVQRGIVALPEELLMEVGKAPKTMTVLLSCPGHPFAVRSVKSNLGCLSAAVRPGDRPGEIKLDVRYGGAAPSGDLAGVITVETDDPKQPTLRVRVVGSVQ